MQRGLGIALATLAAIGAGWWVTRSTGAMRFDLGALPAAIAPPTPLAPLPQDPAIQVYFNYNPLARFRDRLRGIERPGDDLEARLAAAITSAQQSVEVAVQELRSPEIARALVERHRAGVAVRLILENEYARGWSSYSPSELAALPERDRRRIEDYLRLGDLDRDGRVSLVEVERTDAVVMVDRAGIPWLDDRADGSKGSGLMHHKFVVVDRARVLVTTANFTPSDLYGDLGQPASRGNPNSLLEILSPEVAAWFSQEFALMWGDGPGGNPNSRFGPAKPLRPVRQTRLGETALWLQFSPAHKTDPWPQTSAGLIARSLATARRSADAALFVFSDQRLADALDLARQRGAQIRAVIDPQFAFRNYSEAWDLLGLTLPDDRCQPEANNRPWQGIAARAASPPPTGSPAPDDRAPVQVAAANLGPGDLLHHKFAVLDARPDSSGLGSTPPTVIVGSHNWSDVANTRNDETVLVIKSARVAAHYQREFDRLWAQTRPGLTASAQTKLDQARQACGLPAPSPEAIPK